MDQNATQLKFLVQHLYKHQHFLKRTIVLIVTISVFSLFLCLSSGFSLLPLDSFYVYFNTCLFSILTHSLERKYMFLICNGILAFLAQSNSYYSVPSFDPQLSFSSTLSSAKPPLISGHHSEEEAEDIENLIPKEEEEDTEKMIQEEEEEEEGNKGEMEQAGSEEESESTEELNRRIEEFIRKMKQDIRIESQQQLIAV